MYGFLPKTSRHSTDLEVTAILYKYIRPGSSKCVTCVCIYTHVTSNKKSFPNKGRNYMNLYEYIHTWMIQVYIIHPLGSRWVVGIPYKAFTRRWFTIAIVALERIVSWPSEVSFNSLSILSGTLQGTKISHLGKRKIIFKSALSGDMLVPRRVLGRFLT